VHSSIAQLVSPSRQNEWNRDRSENARRPTAKRLRQETGWRETVYAGVSINSMTSAKTFADEKQICGRQKFADTVQEAFNRQKNWILFLLDLGAYSKCEPISVMFAIALKKLSAYNFSEFIFRRFIDRRRYDFFPQY
jgi:hypothetical protein